MAKELENQIKDLEEQIESKRRESQSLEAKAESLSDADAALDAHTRSQSIQQWLLPKLRTALQDLVGRVVERDAAAEAERIDKESAEKIAGLESGYQELAAAYTAWQTALVPLRSAALFPRLRGFFSAVFPLDNIATLAKRLPDEIAAWRLQDTASITEDASRQKRDATKKINVAAQKLYLTEPENEPAELAV